MIIALYKSTFTISYYTIRGATCPDEWEWTLTMHNRWCVSDAAVCQTERFSARCDGDDEVILVTSAQYGRMKVSRCVQVMHRLIGRYRRAFKHRNSFRHKPPHKHQHAAEICGNMVQNCLTTTSRSTLQRGPDTWMVPFCWQPDGRGNET